MIFCSDQKKTPFKKKSSVFHFEGLVINYGKWGATKWEKSHVRNFLPLKEWKLFSLCAPPPPPHFSMAKTFSAPRFHRGKTSHAPPSRFVAPPLPVISDQSLSCERSLICLFRTIQVFFLPQIIFFYFEGQNPREGGGGRYRCYPGKETSRQTRRERSSE